MAYVRTVRTASGATAEQIVHSTRRGSRDIEHLGSAHDESELEALKVAAQRRIAAGQAELDLGLDAAVGSGPLEIVSSRMSHLWDALCRGYDTLRFTDATGGDEPFRDLVLARIEPTSKLDSLRVLDEVGTDTVSYRTLARRLPAYAELSWRQRLAAACAQHAALGPTALILYDVTTLCFQTDAGDGFREPGYSKERRLDPQITIGLLTDSPAGFPLMVEAFEGNKTQTATMIPTITAFKEAHALGDVTVVADAGMVSETNRVAIEAAGLSFILGAKIAQVPYVVTEWRREHPDQQIPDGHVFTQPWPAGPTDQRRDQVIYYQFRADRARRVLRGIDGQIAKAEKTGATKSINRALEAKAPARRPGSRATSPTLTTRHHSS